MQETLQQYLVNFNDYLSLNDVANLLGMQRNTILRYCKEGSLLYRKLGNPVLFDSRLLECVS
jgi:hypothetical protein